MIYFHNAALEFWASRSPGCPTSPPPIHPSSARPAAHARFRFFGHARLVDRPRRTSWPGAELRRDDCADLLLRQGLLVDGEWRHRLSNGQYTVRVAGINQNDPEAFLSDPAAFNAGVFVVNQSGHLCAARLPRRRSARLVNSTSTEIGLWLGRAAPDRSHVYAQLICSPSEITVRISNVHLTGIGDRSYLDARAMYFQILTRSAECA